MFVQEACSEPLPGRVRQHVPESPYLPHAWFGAPQNRDQRKALQRTLAGNFVTGSVDVEVWQALLHNAKVRARLVELSARRAMAEAADSVMFVDRAVTVQARTSVRTTAPLSGVQAPVSAEWSKLHSSGCVVVSLPDFVVGKILQYLYRNGQAFLCVMQKSDLSAVYPMVASARSRRGTAWSWQGAARSLQAGGDHAPNLTHFPSLSDA